MKDFTGGIWLNEGEAPNNTYSPFIENLDLLPGGGVQKRHPSIRAALVAATAAMVYSTTGCGPMTQWLQNDPTNGSQYVVIDLASAAGGVRRWRLYTIGNATPIATANTTIFTNPTSFVHASSDAGAFWYIFHGGNAGVLRVNPTGPAAGTMGATFNDNLAAPANLQMPRSDLGVQHLAAYFFLGRLNEGGVDKPNRIRWSHPGRFEDYRTNDKLDVGDASPIVGLYSVKETLLIVKQNSLWVLTGYDPDTFQLRKVADLSFRAGDTSNTPLAGCSHAQYGAFIYVAGSGILHWDGTKLKDISGGLRDAVVDARVVIRNMSIVGETVYCSGGGAFQVGPDSINDKSWEYNIRAEAWTQHNAPFRGLAPIQASVTGTPKAYSVNQFGADGGYSFNYYRQAVAAGSWADTWSGSSVNIVCTQRIPWQDARNPARKKRWTRPWIVANKRPNASASDPVTYGVVVYRDWDGVHASKFGSVTAVKATDTSAYESLYGYGHSSDGSDYDEGLRLPSIGTAYSVQVTVTSAGTPKDQWGFDSLTLKYVPRSLR